MKALSTGDAVWAIMNASPDLPFRVVTDLVHVLASRGIELARLPDPAWSGAPRVRDRDGDGWTLQPDGNYACDLFPVRVPPDQLDKVYGPCTPT